MTTEPPTYEMVALIAADLVIIAAGYLLAVDAIDSVDDGSLAQVLAGPILTLEEMITVLPGVPEWLFGAFIMGMGLIPWVMVALFVVHEASSRGE